MAPGADETVVVPWPSGLIPPATVSTPGGPVTWHPCLLAEITPHDGPTPTGNHVWDDNNLAQKNISIADADSASGTDIRAAMVIGSLTNKAECLILEVNRGRLPREVQLYIDLMDRRLLKHLLAGRAGKAKKEPSSLNTLLRVSEMLDLSRLREELAVKPAIKPELTAVTRCLPGSLTLPRPSKQKDWRRGVHDGREVVFLEPKHRVRLPICAGPGHLSPVVIGGIPSDNMEPGEYEVVLIQRQPDGTPSGSATIMIRVGKRKG